MRPFPAMGYTRRKPNTGNRSVRIDEEAVPERALCILCNAGIIVRISESSSDIQRYALPIGTRNAKYSEELAKGT